MRKFRVNVIGCNVVAFTIAFAGYIKSWSEGWFDDRVFALEAPQEIYDQIDNLREECIEILED